jgi:hypothetical protein
MANSFITDDALQEIMFRGQPAGAGMSDSLMAKAKFHTMHKLYTALVKRIPFSEASKHMLMMDELAEVLRKPGKVKELTKQMEDMAPGVKRRFIEETVEEVKRIGYNPNAKLTGDVNLDKQYVSKGGVVSDDPSLSTLSEAQTQIVRESLGSNIKTDEVMSVVNKMMEGKRAESILSSVNAKMKADDTIGNMRMLKNIIKKESDYIVKAIESDMGIKLPQEEAEKIYRLKIAEMLKECE